MVWTGPMVGDVGGGAEGGGAEVQGGAVRAGAPHGLGRERVR